MLFGFNLKSFFLWFKRSAIERELEVFNSISNRLHVAMQKANDQFTKNLEKISDLDGKNHDLKKDMLRGSRIIDKISDLLRV